MRVFFVEDNYDMQKIFKETFDKLGWFVVEMVDTTCDDTFKKAISSKADLFFLDIDVEYPTAGLDFAKRLHRHDKDVKIVYLTNTDQCEEAYNTKKYPEPVDYIPKTRHTEDIVKLLKSFKVGYENKKPKSVVLSDTKYRVVLEKDIVLVKKGEYDRLIFVLNDGTNVTDDSDKRIRSLVNPDSDYFISTLTKADGNSLLVNKNYIKTMRRIDKNGRLRAVELVLRLDNGIEIIETTSSREASQFLALCKSR